MPTFGTVRVAAVPATLVILDAEASVDKTLRLVDGAAAEGARLIVLPRGLRLAVPVQRLGGRRDGRLRRPGRAVGALRASSADIGGVAIIEPPGWVCRPPGWFLPAAGVGLAAPPAGIRQDRTELPQSHVVLPQSAGHHVRMARDLSIVPQIGAELSDRRADGQTDHVGRSAVIEGLVADLAGRQHGVVSRRQLVRLGLGRRAIAHRMQRSALHALHQGVYAVGHRALSRVGRWMAAVLAAGPDAVLSHRSAAALWGIRSTARPSVEITAPRPVRRGLSLQAHLSRLKPDERTVARGIPVTTAARTLLDLATVVTVGEVERAINEAEVMRLADASSLITLVERNPGRRGVRAIRGCLDRGNIGASVTRSELEVRFLDFLDDAGLRRPEVNVSVDTGNRTFEVDCLWRAHGVVAELGGRSTHATTAAFERDRARDRALQAAGWRVIRVTWRQLHTEHREVARDLKALLCAPNAHSGPS